MHVLRECLFARRRPEDDVPLHCVGSGLRRTVPHRIHADERGFTVRQRYLRSVRRRLSGVRGGMSQARYGPLPKMCERVRTLCRGMREDGNGDRSLTDARKMLRGAELQLRVFFGDEKRSSNEIARTARKRCRGRTGFIERPIAATWNAGGAPTDRSDARVQSQTPSRERKTSLIRF
jgi:hypothetical protein